MALFSKIVHEIRLKQISYAQFVSITPINSGEKEIGPKKVLEGFKKLGSVFMKRKSALVQIIEMFEKIRVL